MARFYIWLDKVLDRFEAERDQAETERALQRMSPEQLADIGLTPEEVREREEIQRRADALAYAARWGL